MIYHPDAESALAPLWPLFDWPVVRRNKCLALYTLARRVENGAIVELGTYHGCGTIALAIGSRDGHQIPIHTIDPFVTMQGWIGEPYGPDDFDIFQSNIESVGSDLGVDVHVHRIKSEDTATRWNDPIGLFFWDIGGSRVPNDFHDWSPHMEHGGVFAVKDLPTWQFGTGAIAKNVDELGYAVGSAFPQACIWTFVRL